jgi:hypothetical protein
VVEVDSTAAGVVLVTGWLSFAKIKKKGVRYSVVGTILKKQ